MTTEEIKKNIATTGKIISFALKNSFGKGYEVKTEMLNLDINREGELASVVAYIEVKTYGESYIEAADVYAELKKQETIILSFLRNETASLSKNGLIVKQPLSDDLFLLGPVVSSITLNSDEFTIEWVVEIGLE